MEYLNLLLYLLKGKTCIKDLNMADHISKVYAD